MRKDFGSNMSQKLGKSEEKMTQKFVESRAKIGLFWKRFLVIFDSFSLQNLFAYSAERNIAPDILLANSFYLYKILSCFPGSAAGAFTAVSS